METGPAWDLGTPAKLLTTLICFTPAPWDTTSNLALGGEAAVKSSGSPFKSQVLLDISWAEVITWLWPPWWGMWGAVSLG